MGRLNDLLKLTWLLKSKDLKTHLSLNLSFFVSVGGWVQSSLHSRFDQ